MKKIFISTVVLCLLGTLLATAVGAHNTPPIGSGRLAGSGGIGDVDYYVTNTALATGYSGLIDNAANSWVVTGYGWNPIYMYKTSDSSISNMDIYATAAGLDGSNAWTYLYNIYGSTHVRVNGATTDWLYGEITLNVSYLNGYSNDTRQGVIAHEMGHVFGLAEHNHDPYSVMCQMGAGRAVTRPGKVDHDGINDIY